MTRCFPLALISAVILCASSTNAAIVADALLYNWEASDGANANATTWTSPIGTINPVIDINTDVSRVGVSSETTISNAYDFTGWADDTSDGTATRSGTNDAFSVAESDLTDTDVTIELWIKPDGLTNGNQVVFETGGGTRGFNVSLWDDELRFAVKVNDGAENDPTNIVAHTLTSSDIGDFIQVVAVVDSANTLQTLYVNPIDSSDPSANEGTNSWAGDGDNPLGSSGVGLGGVNAGTGGNEFGGGSQEGGTAGSWEPDDMVGFEGQIAILRVYDDVLTGGEVAQNFNAVVPEPSSLALAGLGLIGLLAGGAKVPTESRTQDVQLNLES